MKKGDAEIPGLTDNTQPRRLGPKRVGKIRKLFNLSKEDDVRQYVVHRPLPEKDGKKPRSKAPKIQRLVTPARIQVTAIHFTVLFEVIFDTMTRTIWHVIVACRDRSHTRPTKSLTTCTDLG